MYTQDNRRLVLTTPFGGDTLLLRSMTGREEMSSLYEFELDMASAEGGLSAQEIVGKEVTFTVQDEDVGPRAFGGFVSRFSAGPLDEHGLREYRATVVPKLWFLTKRTNCRIYQQMTAIEIIESVLGDASVTDYSTARVSGTYATREYCVQYGETDFDFISRLMEEEGVFYFFRFDDAGAHELIMADDVAVYEACEPNELPYFRGSFEGHHVTNWEHVYEFISGAFAHTDYNFTTPQVNLLKSTNTVVDLAGVSSHERYEYPGIHETGAFGESKARIRMEAEEARFDIVEGASTCPALRVGGTFKLSAEFGIDAEEGNQVVIQRLNHSAHEDSYQQGGGSASYSNSFRCLPSSVIFRAPRRAPKAIIRGPQTAVVVGPSGEEIYTDEHGRIKVQFHWDRQGQKNETSSCWIRVAQIWAGKNWGAQYIPRIGQEVVVEFLEGDPDRPLVTGGVYNADLPPTYEVPANKTQSGIKSRSSKEGTPDNFNEIRFEDKKGSEELYIHAEKDRTEIVENDHTLTVGRNQSFDVGNNRKEQIGNDRALSVGNDKSETVGNNKKVSVGANHDENIGSNMTLGVSNNRSMSVGENLEETIGDSMELTVAKDRQVTIGKDETTEIGKDHSSTIGGKSTVSIAKEYKVDAKKIQLVAADELSIKVGKAKLVMKKNGDITINGKKLTLKGSGDIVLKGSKIAQN